MKNSRNMRIILFGVGTLLVLLGLREVALGAIGKSAHATVTQVERAVGQQDDPMDHNYQVSYRFSVNGRDYTGHFGLKKVYNAATLPSIGAPVTVRYVPAAPAINGGPDAGPLGGLVLGALGLLLVFLGVKPARATASPVPPQLERTDANREG